MTSFNNIRSLIKTGRTCWEDTWDDSGLDYIRREEFKGSIVDNAPGILVYTNSDIYLNDTYCLGDPLLSKLPAVYNPSWRVGHLKRVCPEEYRYSVEEDKNLISDPDLREYYDKILLITRGDLFSTERLKAVMDLNTGKYDYLVENYVSRHPETVRPEE